MTKKIRNWALYDWANSAFATVVIAGFFPIFFKEYWNAGIDVSISSARLGIGSSIAALTIAIMAPLLGAKIDKTGQHRRTFCVFILVGIFSTTALFFIGKGLWFWALGCFILANLGFSLANVFYDGFIDYISEKENVDKVSSYGYALGYLGGGLLFLICVVMTLFPKLFGLTSITMAIKLSFLFVAIWWGLFSIPLLTTLPKKMQVKNKKSSFLGFQDVVITMKNIIKTTHLKWFLLAYWCYMDGIWTIIKMAVDYGLALGFPSHALITALLITQFIGVPFTLLFGKIAKRKGPLYGIKIAVSAYFVITIWGVFMSSVWEFYVLAALIGIVQGGAQALSRSFFVTQIPKGQEAEYFGFYNMIGKFSAILGPLLMGVTTLTLNQLGIDDFLTARLSILSLLLFFVLGLFFLKKAR